MSQQFSIGGSFEILPETGNPQGQVLVSAPVSEKVYLSNYVTTVMQLTSDSPASVSLGPLTAVNVVVLRVVGQKIRVRYTSSDGSSQAVPVDPFTVVISEPTNIAALDLTRTAGSDTTVYVTLGQKG